MGVRLTIRSANLFARHVTQVIGSCLGDLFSVTWLENSDIPSLFHTETLDAQFAIVKNDTTESHVQKVSLKSIRCVMSTHMVDLMHINSLVREGSTHAGSNKYK